MADPRSAPIFASLRAAARVTHERFLVGASVEKDRKRLVAALGQESLVVELPSTEEALDRLAQESFELLVMDSDSPADARRTYVACRQLMPLADLIVLADCDPTACVEAFAAPVAGLLPRPLPDSDALLRAHLRWLVACRRSRTRARLLDQVLLRHKDELLSALPALAAALAEIAGAPDAQPGVMVRGDTDLVAAAGGRATQTSADVVVVGLGAADSCEARLLEARTRASGAAIVVVDSVCTPQRMRAAIYGGARAYLDRSGLPELAGIVALTALRRRSEVAGRRFVETLARFGALADDDAGVAPAPQDVDPRRLPDATANGGIVVPSGHEVLIVDDEVVVLTVLREALRRGGYRVTTAASAEEAIGLMRQRQFDLVLTDKNLPGASGLEVLRVARSLDPAPAVVLITGYSSYDSAVEAMEIGALDYIEKPIRDVENLRFRIRRALSRRDEQMARGPAPTTDAGRGRVLLVETEGSRRQLLAEFLGRTFHVSAAADGDEALRLLQGERYDVVLADRNLPGMSGLRVIEQAQRLLPHCASVLYTAYPSYETVKEAFELGVDAFLVRPSEDLKSLAERVAGALRSRGGILLG